MQGPQLTPAKRWMEIDLVRRLHRQCLEGEITLRSMAKELGLEYRELYALLEELNLPIA